MNTIIAIPSSISGPENTFVSIHSILDTPFPSNLSQCVRCFSGSAIAQRVYSVLDRAPATFTFATVHRKPLVDWL